MKVPVDTNVILDVLLRRAPFFDNSRAVYELVELRRITACVSSSAMTDIFYLLYKACNDAEKVYLAMDTLCADVTIVPILENTIKGAIALRWKDFEDSVQYMAAQENGVEQIITRNAGDFEADDIPCVSPAEFLDKFEG